MTKPIDYDAVRKKIERFDRELNAHWSKWRQDAREWYDMVAGEQWDPDALAQMRDENRNPVVINRVDPMVSAISGAEITNRQEVKYSPREVGDVQVNELFTGAVKWSRDECDAADEDSHAFRDAVICGLGVTETRMDYDDDPEGMVRLDRIDPLEIWVDANARKPNFSDATYLKRMRRFTEEDAQVLFPNLVNSASRAREDANPHESYPNSAYNDRSNNQDAPCPVGMVDICEYQWREYEAVTLITDPQTNQSMQLSAEETERLMQAGIDPFEMLGGIRMKRTVWKRAFKANDALICEPLPDDEFSYKFITGKLDRNKGLPYGVVRSMMDPQRWSNKFISQLDRIISVNAKGGLLAEKDAFDDPQQAQDDWARADSIVWASQGAVAAGKIIPKPPSPYPQGIDRLFTLAMESIPHVTGVNAEMLGMAQHEQPGVLEYQRKQAAYGILSIFFDSLRKYRKAQGRLHLKMVAKYMSDGRLVRIVNPKTGQQQYVPLIHDPNVLRFDVVVDEAPHGPNAVERTWQILVSSGPILKSILESGLPPEVVLEILNYSPFPSSLVDKLREKMTQPDPQQQQMQQMQMQMQMQAAQADIAKKVADAKLAEANATKALAEAQAQLAQMQGGGEGEAPDEVASARLLIDARRQKLDEAKFEHEKALSLQAERAKRSDADRQARLDGARLSLDVAKADHEAEDKDRRFALEVDRENAGRAERALTRDDAREETIFNRSERQEDRRREDDDRAKSAEHTDAIANAFAELSEATAAMTEAMSDFGEVKQKAKRSTPKPLEGD